MQLTDATFYPRLPNWSPDDARVLFMALPPHGGATRAYLVSSQGGTLRLLFPREAGPETDPNWSPDEWKIVFSTSREAGDDAKSVIRILELDSNHVITLPGSVGMFSPQWSPDGHSIATLNPKSIGLNIFDLRTQQWSTPYKGGGGFPRWSREATLFTFWGSVIRVFFEFRSPVQPSEEGTPQGGSISVLLSNVYLHYVLDLWFERVVKPRLRGEAYWCGISTTSCCVSNIVRMLFAFRTYLRRDWGSLA